MRFSYITSLLCMLSVQHATGSMAWGLAAFWAIMSIRLAMQEQAA